MGSGSGVTSPLLSPVRSPRLCFCDITSISRLAPGTAGIRSFPLPH